MNWEDAIAAMLKASKSEGLPDGEWIDACQSLADVIAEIGERLTEEHLAILVGVGALMARQGFREMQAGIQTELFFNRP